MRALAKEIAEETVSKHDIDISKESSVGGVFQKLIKNPSKLLRTRLWTIRLMVLGALRVGMNAVHVNRDKMRKTTTDKGSNVLTVKNIGDLITYF